MIKKLSIKNFKSIKELDIDCRRINLFITYLKNHDTRVRKLKNEEISVLLDSDPFFNVNYFLEEV